MLGPEIALIEDKYEKLSQKIFRIQNIELKNPIRSENLEYQIDKSEVNIQRTIKDYDKKSEFLQSEVASLKRLFQSKEEIRRLNIKKVSDERELTENNLMNSLKAFREEATKKIDSVVKSIEGSLEQMKERQSGSKEQIMASIAKLQKIAEVDAVKLQNEAEAFSNENKANVTSTSQLLNDEFQYIYTQVQQTKDLRKENENKFIKDIQVEMNKIQNEIANSKNERLKFEERIFETLNETIQRIHNSVDS